MILVWYKHDNETMRQQLTLLIPLLLTDGRTARRTDRQTETSCHGIVRAMHTRRAVKVENSTSSKYKMVKDTQTPPRIYDYVAELSCCAKSMQNRLTQFCWGNRGS